MNNKEKTYNYYLVSLVDILGQKSAFDKVPCIPKTDNEINELKLALKKTIVFIKRFREGFEGFFNEFSRDRTEELNIPEDKKDIFKEISRKDIKYQYFSDLFIAYISLKTDTHFCAALNGIYGVLAATASSFLFSLFRDHTIRGGIEIDCALEMEYKDNKEIYGPVLNKAYLLESEKAQYPRILIGKELLRFLNIQANNPDNTIYGEVSRIKARSCLDMIYEDRDGLFSLDYLSKPFLDQLKLTLPITIDNTTITYDALISKCRSFLLSQREKHRYDNDKLFLNYSIVLDHFERRTKDASNQG